MRKHLLPRFSQTGSYSARAYDMTRAYQVLCHAEVEECIEVLYLGFATRAVQRWNATRRLQRSTRALLGYYALVKAGRSLKKLPRGRTRLRPPRTMRVTARTMAAAHTAFLHVVSGNHGLKDANVRRMGACLGIAEDDFDPVWLAAMDTFGRSRGDTAHRSVRSVPSVPDPATQRQLVKDVISGVRRLDMMLQRRQ